MLVSSARYCPCAMMEPEVGRSRPAMRLRSVDFPDPEEPSSARNSFRATDSDTSLTAWMVAPPMVYWRETRSSWMAVSALGIWVNGCGQWAVNEEYAATGAEISPLSWTRWRDPKLGRPMRRGTLRGRVRAVRTTR